MIHPLVSEKLIELEERTRQLETNHISASELEQAFQIAEKNYKPEYGDPRVFWREAVKFLEEKKRLEDL